MLITTLDYYIAKVEPYMFKPNKHEEEQKKKNIIIIYFINDKEEKNERSGMRWSERAEKKDKRKETKCVKSVGTAICAARTKNGQIHYNPVRLIGDCD